MTDEYLMENSDAFLDAISKKDFLELTVGDVTNLAALLKDRRGDEKVQHDLTVDEVLEFAKQLGSFPTNPNQKLIEVLSWVLKPAGAAEAAPLPEEPAINVTVDHAFSPDSAASSFGPISFTQDGFDLGKTKTDEKSSKTDEKISKTDEKSSLT